MGLLSPFYHFVARQLLENPAQKQDYAQLKEALMTNEATILRRLEKANPKEERNHRVMTHIIGIERWGQTRLRQFLGEPAGEREYDSYRPPQDTDWDTMPDLFQQTRAATITLINNLQAGAPTEHKIAHNTFGALSTKGWLRYLTTHAEMESKRLS